MKIFGFKLFIIVVCAFSFLQVNAQILPPEFICISNDTLIWEIPNNPCGAFNGYQVFGSQNEAGPYEIITTITDQNQERFFHAAASGSTWFYYLTSDFNCPGEMAINSDTLDNLIPEESPIVFVSVRDNGIEIEWEESPSPEVFAYLIFRNTVAGTVAIDTVFNNNTYIDVNADPLNQFETYFVNALDQCGNTSLFDQSHSTMFLNLDEIDACEQTINMNWTPYEGWSSGVAMQEIWMSLNGAPFTMIETIQGDATSYLFQNADDGNTYCFYIQATQADDQTIASRSNSFCETLDIVQPVRNFALKNASIQSDSTVIIEWAWNSNAELQTYSVLSSIDNGNFDELDMVNPTLPLSPNITFVDNSISNISSPLSYRVTSLDVCDKMDSTNIVTTMFLRGTAGENTTNELQWTPYINPLGNITGYEVHRIVDGKDDLVQVLDGNTTIFADVIDQSLLNLGPACYYIVAVTDISLPSGIQETIQSRSNIICLEQEAAVYMPNAFVPDGLINREFKPVLQFGDPQQYQLLIFDRWGQQVFQSESVEIGWDGKMGDRLLPQGVYVYYLKVIQSGGNVTERKGTVLLLR